MGGGLSGHFKNTQGGSGNTKVFSDNIARLTEKFPVSESGYFGKKGQSGKVRNIESDDPVATAQDFFQMATEGVATIKTNSKGRVFAEFEDGTMISFRPVSHSDGSPAVDINISGSGPIKTQKIHFISKGD